MTDAKTPARIPGPGRMMRWMLAAAITGLVLLGSGLYLLAFTAAASEWGIEGIGLVVLLITLGVFLLVPAKIYIIIRFTQRRRQRSGARD